MDNASIELSKIWLGSEYSDQASVSLSLATCSNKVNLHPCLLFCVTLISGIIALQFQLFDVGVEYVN